MDGHLPKTWDLIPLGHLTVHVLGGDWGKNADYDDPAYVCVRCIRASELRDWENDLGSTAALRKIKKSSLTSRELRSGDIVVEVSGGGPEQPVGRTALINSAVLAKNPGYPKVCTNFFRQLRPAREMNSSFLDLYLKFFYKTGRIIAYQGGSNNLRNLKFDDYLKIRVPIPPATEQHRIVTKIEELFSELDSGVKSLKKARDQLRIYRQSVLKHAFEGKLTAQWREENKDILESPNQLVARIEQERTAHYQRQLNEWKAAGRRWEESGELGKKPTRPRRPRSLDIVAASPTHNPFWTRLLLDELATQTVLGKMLDRQKNKGISRPYLGNINLRWGKFDLENLKTMRVEKSEIQRYSLVKGDLVICEGGEPGRCAVWESTDRTMVIQKALHRVRFTESYSPYFAFYFMMYAAKSDLLSRNFTGSTIKHLTGRGLRHVFFPICSLAEQEQVVETLNSCNTLCNELEYKIARGIRRTNALRQSILEKAFSGQFVAQYPNDEPASVLLERIKAEKSAQSHTAKLRNKRRRAKVPA